MTDGTGHGFGYGAGYGAGYGYGSGYGYGYGSGSGLGYDVDVLPNGSISIGCQGPHRPEYWAANWRAIASDNGVAEHDAERLGRYLGVL